MNIRPEKDQATFVASVSAFPSFHNLTNHTTGYNFALKFAFQWGTNHNLVLFWDKWINLTLECNKIILMKFLMGFSNRISIETTTGYNIKIETGLWTR